MGSKSLPSVVFPLLIARVIKTSGVASPCLCSEAWDCLCTFLWPPGMARSSGNLPGPTPFPQRSGTSFLTGDTIRITKFQSLCLTQMNFCVLSRSFLPSFPSLACSSRSSRVPLASYQPSRCVKVWDGGCFWAGREERGGSCSDR